MWRHMVGGDEMESTRVMLRIDVEVSGENSPSGRQ